MAMSTNHHDAFYRDFFSDPDLIRQLIADFLPPEVSEALDVSRLERIDTSFVGEHDQARESDLIWKVYFKDGQPLYLYLLLEFQSSDDRRMPLRMLQYVISLYEHLIREKQVSLDQGLPPVLPVVLYNGDKRWQTPTSLEQLIRHPAFLARWQPKLEYLLLDEGALDKRQLAEQDLFIAAIFELDAPGPVEDVVAVAQRLSALWRKHPLAPELAEAIKDWFYDALLTQGVDKEQIRQLLEGEIAMFGEKFVRWQEQTLQLGMQQGLQQGVRMTALGMHKIGLSLDVIAKATGQNEATIRQWIRDAELEKDADDHRNGDA